MSRKDRKMNRQQAIELLMLLSALESWSFSAQAPIPDYLHERLADQIETLKGIALDSKS
jgi:hypothetical protein